MATPTPASRSAGASKTRKVLSSHNPELDSKIGGGIPAGSLVLIEGGSGSGKSVLAQQMLWGALQDGNSSVLFTTENTVTSLTQQMQTIDLDILDFVLLGRCRVYPVQLARLGPNALLMLAEALRMEKQRDLIIVNSITAGITQKTDHHQLLGFFEECKHICTSGATIMIVLHPLAVNEEVLGTVTSMCDAHLRLRSEQDGQRLIKLLEVAKVRGAASVTGAIVGFEVEPGWGMRIIPISKARG